MRELYAYVWRVSASQQIVLIILAIIAAVLATAPLELQRHIINTLAGHEKVENLAWLCGGYLIAVLGIGGLKYIVNMRYHACVISDLTTGSADVHHLTR